MVDLIETHVFDLLQADASLYAAGNAWPAGWKGVKRIDTDVPACAGYVNLYEAPYENAAGQNRPAIYLGTAAVQASDRLYQQLLSIPPAQWRCVTLPLVAVAQAPTRREAKRMVNQLRANMKSIIWRHQKENGYWFRLDFPGDAGGGLVRDVVKVSATGANGQGVAEAVAIVSVQIYYYWDATSDA